MFTDTNDSAFWGSAGSAPATLGATHGKLLVDFLQGGQAKVTINGVLTVLTIGFAPRACLSINDTRVTFRDIAWN